MFEIQGILIFVITTITGLIGVPIIQAIKNYFGLEEKYAMLLAGAVAFVLGGVVVGVSGQFTEITFENIPLIFSAVYTASNIFYNLFKNGTSIVSRALGISKAQIQG